MSTSSNTTPPAERKSLWLGIAKFLLLAALVITLFLLGQSMVRHRFFRGGRVNQRDVLRP